MPIYQRLPKRGFTSRVRLLGKNQYKIVHLADVERSFEDGTIIGPEQLAAAGYRLTPHQKAGYKVLASGELSKKLNLEVHSISASARELVEKAGGSVNIIAKGGSASDSSEASS